MITARVVIKKYENRRLYDTAASRYVNLEDVARMVRDGVDVQVIDASTGEDLTRVILTQIIMEDAKGHGSGLPLDLLQEMVRASDRATHEFLSWYLRTAFEMYQKTQTALHARLSETRAALANPLEAWRAAFSGQQTPGPAEAELAELRKRVQELEQRLAETRPTPSRKRTGAKRPPRATKRSS